MIRTGNTIYIQSTIRQAMPLFLYKKINLIALPKFYIRQAFAPGNQLIFLISMKFCLTKYLMTIIMIQCSLMTNNYFTNPHIARKGGAADPSTTRTDYLKFSIEDEASCNYFIIVCSYFDRGIIPRCIASTTCNCIVSAFPSNAHKRFVRGVSFSDECRRFISKSLIPN